MRLVQVAQRATDLDRSAAFYADVLGSLRGWAAAPPKLRPAHPTPPDIDETIPAALASTDFSSQDEPGETRAGVDDSSATYVEASNAPS